MTQEEYLVGINLHTKALWELRVHWEQSPNCCGGVILDSLRWNWSGRGMHVRFGKEGVTYAVPSWGEGRPKLLTSVGKIRQLH